MVSTTDFFPPLVDHPSDFGAIAAANACSDVFAMGGRVVIAINVAAFPEHFPREAIVAIFEAAAAVVAEAGGTIAGGHTIRNPEPIFGLAVQGLVHPDRIFRKEGARVGDVLMLSKPLGTGVALAGGSAERQGRRHRRHAPLNRAASEALQAHRSARSTPSPTSPATGSSGHGWEMAERCRRRVFAFDDDGPAAVPGRRPPRCAGACAPVATRATATTSSEHVDASTPASATTARRSATTRRPPAVCSPPSIRRSPTISPRRASRAIGTVVAGEPAHRPAVVRATDGSVLPPSKPGPRPARIETELWARRARRSSSASTRSAVARGPVR